MVQLQQGFATGGMGSDRHFAWQQSSRPNARFTPKSGHWLSASERPLCAKSGLMQCSKLQPFVGKRGK
jgi:hypothetical protein